MPFSFEADDNEEVLLDENEVENLNTGDEPAVGEQQDDGESSEEVMQIEVNGEILDVTPTQLSEMVAFARQHSDIDVDDYKTYQAVKPVMNMLAEDPIMKAYVGHRANNWKGEDIIDGLFLNRWPQLAPVIENFFRNGGGQAQQPEEPEFETIAEEMEYRAQKAAQMAVQQAMQQIQPTLSQVVGRVQQYDQSAEFNNVRMHNDSVMTEAFTSVGIDVDSVDDGTLREVASAMRDLYPNVNFASARLSPQQANRIVKAAVMTASQNRQSAGIRALGRQAALPTMLGAGSAREGKSITNKIDGLSKAERKGRLDKLF